MLSSSVEIAELEPSGRTVVLDLAGERLELESRAEQLLDDVVVEVACDARAVLDEQGALAILAGLRQLDREADAAGQVVGDVEFGRP